MVKHFFLKVCQEALHYDQCQSLLACGLGRTGCNIPVHHGDKPIQQESWWTLPVKWGYYPQSINFHSPPSFHGSCLHFYQMVQIKYWMLYIPSFLQDPMWNSSPNLPLLLHIFLIIAIIPFFKGALKALDGTHILHVSFQPNPAITTTKGGVSQKFLAALHLTCTWLHPQWIWGGSASDGVSFMMHVFRIGDSQLGKYWPSKYRLSHLWCTSLCHSVGLVSPPRVGKLVVWGMSWSRLPGIIMFLSSWTGP